MITTHLLPRQRPLGPSPQEMSEWCFSSLRFVGHRSFPLNWATSLLLPILGSFPLSCTLPVCFVFLVFLVTPPIEKLFISSSPRPFFLPFCFHIFMKKQIKWKQRSPLFIVWHAWLLSGPRSESHAFLLYGKKMEDSHPPSPPIARQPRLTREMPSYHLLRWLELFHPPSNSPDSGWPIFFWVCVAFCSQSHLCYESCVYLGGKVRVNILKMKAGGGRDGSYLKTE